MMYTNTHGSLLPMEINGRPGCAQVILGVANGRRAAFPLNELTPAISGPVETIQLAGKDLAGLSEIERHLVLRHCRHLLLPGGRLSLPVGPDPDQFPLTGLNEAAWDTGFDAWVEFVAGRAILGKPRRPATGTSLVSIVMPAYKSDFFAAALSSAQAQTWPHCEIVVCDDSLDDRIATLVAEIEGPHPVRYIRNPGNLGGRDNYLKCFDEARGQYVKYLNDDDLLHPECCARMAALLDAHPAVTLVTSHRQLIDSQGRTLPDEAWNQRLTKQDGLLDGRTLASFVLAQGMNLIGEPTTVMFRKGDMTDSRPNMMSYAGDLARRNGDMSTWTSLLSRGDAIYLTDSLSLFRQHDTQVQKDPEFHRQAVTAWYELRTTARRTGLLAEAHCRNMAPVALDTGGDLAAGEDLFNAGRIQESVAVFQTLLRRDPADNRARGNLSCAWWALGRQDHALVEGVLAHGCDPDNETLALNLQDMLAAGV